METIEITKAIIAVMWEVNNIEKNTTVWTGNNSYKAVSDKDVKKAIRNSMIKNWLSIVPTSVTSKHQIDRWEAEETWNWKTQVKTKQSVFTEVATNYLLLHTSWEAIELAWYGQWVDSQDKGAGKATTYALKNTLINLFLVPTWDDTDNTHSDDIVTPQKKYNWTVKQFYNDTEKHIDTWKDLVADWKTTWKELLEKVTDNWNKLIKKIHKEMILALDN